MCLESDGSSGSSPGCGGRLRAGDEEEEEDGERGCCGRGAEGEVQTLSGRMNPPAVGKRPERPIARHKAPSLGRARVAAAGILSVGNVLNYLDRYTVAGEASAPLRRAAPRGAALGLTRRGGAVRAGGWRGSAAAVRRARAGVWRCWRYCSLVRVNFNANPKRSLLFVRARRWGRRARRRSRAAAALRDAVSILGERRADRCSCRRVSAIRRPAGDGVRRTTRRSSALFLREAGLSFSPPPRRSLPCGTGCGQQIRPSAGRGALRAPRGSALRQRALGCSQCRCSPFVVNSEEENDNRSSAN